MKGDAWLTFKATPPPSGGAADPRGALDFLYLNRQITRREYDAGRLYGAIFKNCDPRSAAIADHCDEMLDRVELDRAPMLRRVIGGHKTPVTADGTQRLRNSLSRLAVEFDQIETGWTVAAAAD
jgi:hypothetical protein